MSKRIKMLAGEATVGELKEILNQVDNSDVIEFTPQTPVEELNNKKLNVPGRDLEDDSIVATSDGEPLYQAAVRDIDGNIIMHNGYIENLMSGNMQDIATCIRTRNSVIADNFAKYMGEAMYNTLEYITEATLNIAAVNKSDTLVEMCKVIERS